jgi:hypothetical protein
VHKTIQSSKRRLRCLKKTKAREDAMEVGMHIAMQNHPANYHSDHELYWNSTGRSAGWLTWPNHWASILCGRSNITSTITR